jgi:hypothetical protein
MRRTRAARLGAAGAEKPSGIRLSSAERDGNM